MSTPIRGKVAYVLDNGDIAINVGLDHGVHLYMCFDVIDDRQLDIKDPDTEEVIGSLEVSKIRVEIIDTQEKISVATPYDGLSVRKRARGVYRVSQSIGPFARFLMPASWIATDAKDSSVKIGDSVIQVIENSDTDDIDEERIEVVNTEDSSPEIDEK